MAKPGPKTQPTQLKIQRGNPGKRALPKNEPQPASGFPPCSEHLTEMAREAWEMFSVQLESAGVGTALDATALELLCTSYAIYRDAAEQVAKYGPCWVAKADGALPSFAFSPYSSVMERERKNIKTLLAEFGMTPSSRTGLAVDKPPEGVRSRRRA